ncbi:MULTISPECIES: DUF5683 domain-containing protein [Petrimonas]|jgi:hypothetical protein|uniref:DUF5683 domain-containing protein n=1 Tax=Petrimonas mucosa TaxID=1642646 RepID=A0A1G4G4V9_9BACT|nr:MULTISPECIES: DUF5683 domain-containing protein [Petrimonas]MDD3561864.1 DUF5683 domain-containing protein [Petrimonas mucosa]SCM56146.1 putative protein {ECO:0000313/EMBL:CEA14906,1} [Petrimonas mucosa]SFU53974.1 hypothetical protein SAMN05216364_10227 [Porphyromonadaceae bacterium KHP3R9]HHT30842.1 hypothetical protein [Petrimonas mucosa]
MLKYRTIVCLLFISVVFHVEAQQNTVPQPPDSVKVIALPDTLVVETGFKPDPKKAVIYSAIFPGLGQIYNRKYWKLPILYGGFVGLSYAITWNNSHYQDYFDAQRALLDDNPDNDDIWKKMLPYGMDPETADRNWFSDVVKDRKNYFRYYRDLSIIITVALYGLGIVDAYVDAQLFEFDVSPDLSMRVEPVLMNRVETNYLADSFGFKCSISF